MQHLDEKMKQKEALSWKQMNDSGIFPQIIVTCLIYKKVKEKKNPGEHFTP